LESLFCETTIKSLTLANRFVRSATWMALAAPDGSCTDPLFECYENLARGELGLIVTGFAYVSREGQGPEGQLGIYADHLVDGLRRLVERVHDQGGKIAVQIVHCGDLSRPENNGGREVLGPSDRQDEQGNPIARALTTAEISRVVDDFGAAAERARAAGFDAVQLHFAHGYLGSQFLCPLHNRREDEYGGSLEHRSRFLREVYAKAREAVGGDYPVLAKLNLEDYVEGGLSSEEGVQVAVQLADQGLDALEISGGLRESGDLGPARRNIEEPEQEAYFLTNAVTVKEATRLPVMLVGGLRTPAVLARIHRETGIDYFSLCRPLIREPSLVCEWREGRRTKADCISCSGCFLSVKKGRGIFCIRKKDRERTS